MGENLIGPLLVHKDVGPKPPPPPPPPLSPGWVPWGGRLCNFDCCGAKFWVKICFGCVGVWRPREPPTPLSTRLCAAVRAGVGFGVGNAIPAAPAARPAARNLDNCPGTGEFIPFVNRTSEGGVVIAFDLLPPPKLEDN